jgi:uncharacterized protein YlxW (UPF0749 family)
MVLVALLAALVTFVGVLQIRSQAEVERSLEGLDSTSLAFLIDDLHQSNDQLAAEQARLQSRRDALSSGSSTAALGELNDEARRLRMLEGVVPVQGPGVVIDIDAPLSAIDLADAFNNLQVGGAEAVAINQHRVITGTPITQGSGAVLINGDATRGPWTFQAIGDQSRLAATADVMTRSLRSDPRVKSAYYATDPDLVIKAVITPRPYVYSTS